MPQKRYEAKVDYKNYEWDFEPGSFDGDSKCRGRLWAGASHYPFQCEFNLFGPPALFLLPGKAIPTVPGCDGTQELPGKLVQPIVDSMYEEFGIKEGLL